jgi:hypothetical protein
MPATASTPGYDRQDLRVSVTLHDVTRRSLHYGGHWDLVDLTGAYHDRNSAEAANIGTG